MKRIKIKNYGTLTKEYDLYELYNDFLGNYMDHGQEIPEEVEMIREFYSVVFDAVESGIYSLDEFETLALRALEKEGISSDYLMENEQDTLSISKVNTLEELADEARAMLSMIEDLAEVEQELENETIEQWLEAELSLFANTILKVHRAGAEELETVAKEAFVILEQLENLEDVEKALSNEVIAGWLEAQLYFVLDTVAKLA